MPASADMPFSFLSPASVMWMVAWFATPGSMPARQCSNCCCRSPIGADRPIDETHHALDRQLHAQAVMQDLIACCSSSRVKLSDSAHSRRRVS
jgi:hypothetical protein